MHSLTWWRIFSGIVCSCVMSVANAHESYSPPTLPELRQAVDQWLAQRNLEQSPIPDAIAPYWQFEESPRTEQLLDSLLKTFYLADDQVRTLVDTLRQKHLLNDVDLSGLLAREQEPLLQQNVLYFHARYLMMANLYEEALQVLEELEPQTLVDPAGYFFYRAVCEHHLLQREAGLKSLATLLNHTENVPARYRNLAELMRVDLEQLEEKSIGEVARQMKDVHRRLDLGRAGQGVQRVEERIIATLDEIIEKLEQQQNSGGGGGGSGQMQPSGGSPADDSYVGGVKGAGQTDRKDLGHKDDWGDLPPKAQTAAKNMLERQFPAHYRQAVEEYLKRVAERPAP